SLFLLTSPRPHQRDLVLRELLRHHSARRPLLHLLCPRRGVLRWSHGRGASTASREARRSHDYLELTRPQLDATRGRAGEFARRRRSQSEKG
ncbi:hypothetical protein DMC30DRAFT_450237, partial [Rhodotorula diobovata]